MSLPSVSLSSRTPFRRVARRAASALLLAAVSSASLAGGLPVAATPASAAGAASYVDCSGDDAADGASAAGAWRTIARANKATLAAGQQLLLKRDCTFTGPLIVKWSGTAADYVVVGAYGEGARPRIMSAPVAGSDKGSSIEVLGTHVTLQDLHTDAAAPRRDPGCRDAAVGWRVGIKLATGSAYNTVRNSELTGHNHGVWVTSTSHHNRILDNNFHDNNMMFQLTPTSTNGSDDSGAVAIALHGDDNEIAGNTFRDNHACSYDFGSDGASIDIYGGDRNVLHHNATTNDDVFAEIGKSSTSGAADNVLAYNSMRADLPQAYFLVTRGAASSYGPVLRTKVYNNTVHLTQTGPSVIGIVCRHGCNSDILTLKGNVIWSGRSVWTDGAFGEGKNVYWSAGGKPYFGDGATRSASSLVADPRFADAATGDYHLQAGSPAIDLGTTDVLGLGLNTDLAGAVVPSGAAPDAGAYEYGTRPTVEQVVAEPTPTAAPTQEPTQEPTATAVSTLEPTATAVSTQEPTATSSPSPEPTVSSTPTSTATVEPTPTAALAVYAEDTFNRTKTDTWDSARTGGRYSTEGTVAEFDVNGAAGTMRVGKGMTRVAWLGGVSAQDVELAARVKTDKRAAGGSQFAYLTARRQADGSEYRGKLRLDPSGAVYLHVTRFAGGKESNLGTEVRVAGLTHKVGGYLRLEMQVVGEGTTAIRLKAWADGQAEPQDWQYTVNDGTAYLQQPGAVALRAYVSGNATNAPVLFSFDDLRVGAAG